MRLDRRGRTVHLQEVEAAILEDVLRDARMTLSDPDHIPNPAVTARLFPDAYPDDAEASAEFRELTADNATQRIDRVERCRVRAMDAVDSGRLDVSDPEVLGEWIQALNEVRLIMGTRLGVTGDEHEVDADDPLAEAFAVYHWFSALQDGLVTAAMR